MSRNISVSASCFLPAAFFSLRLTAWLASKAGFAGIEAAPFRGPVLEVLLGGTPDNLVVPITSVHCHFNPIPILQKIREFGKGAALTDLVLFPPLVWCEKFLAEFARKSVSVNTYFIHDLEKRSVFNSFQLHPDLGLGLERILNLLEATGFKATVDLRHIRRGKDPRQEGGHSPLPTWRETWENLHSLGLVDNIHIQYLDLDELQRMLKSDENIEIAEMLRVIGQSNYEGLITLEISPIDVARIVGPKAFLPQVQTSYLSQLRQFVEAEIA